MFDGIDRRTPLDDLMERDEADLDTLVLEIADRNREWGERLRLAVAEDRRETVRVHEAADALEAVFAWLTREGEPMRGAMARWMVVHKDEEWLKLSRAEQVAHKVCRLFSARLMAAVFVLAPGLLRGISESEIAARLGVTRALISHYVTDFADTFGQRSRGMKSFVSRFTFSAAQVGSWKARKKETKQEKTEEGTLI